MNLPEIPSVLEELSRLHEGNQVLREESNYRASGQRRFSRRARLPASAPSVKENEPKANLDANIADAEITLLCRGEL